MYKMINGRLTYVGRGKPLQPLIRRREFVPNLNSRGPRNLPIRTLPNRPKQGRNRNRNRRNRGQYRPKLRIMYGQQQDLAFGSQNTKGMGSTFTTPVSESKIITSFFEFSNDSITFCQPIPASFYILNEAIIPIHPMFYFGRTANMSLNFANFQITRAIAHYVPLIGSTSTGMVAIGSTRNCTPVTYDTTIAFTALTQISAEINPVWMCSKHEVRDLDSSVKNMAPMNRKDIPNVVFVVGTGLAGSLLASATIFMQMTIKLSRPNPSPSLTPFAAVAQIIISAAGVRSNTVITSNSHGIVINSTAINIDIGEYTQCPPFPVVATDYEINFTHNNSSIDYASVPDQGTVYIAYFMEN